MALIVDRAGYDRSSIVHRQEHNSVNIFTVFKQRQELGEPSISLDVLHKDSTSPRSITEARWRVHNKGRFFKTMHSHIMLINTIPRDQKQFLHLYKQECL